MKFLSLLCCLFALSCSYRVGNLHRSIPGKHQKIAVPSFKNSTMEVGLESYFTNAMIEELLRADFVKLVSQDKADVVLEGTVISIKYSSSGALTNSSITELPENAVLNSSYDASVVVQLKLRQTSDDKVIWTGNFSGTKNIRAAQIGAPTLNSANPNYDYSAKQYTMGVLGKQLMSEAYSRMTEGF
jgi:hypothetical protein